MAHLLRPLAVFLAIALAGCQSAGEHGAAVRQGQDAGDKLTVGTVQREIRVGMTNAAVAEVLGAPNMVTTDEQRRETWVYDKVATDKVYSTSSGGVNAIIFGGGGSSAGAVSTTQRTLTVIVKFDEASKVRDFAYRSSSF